MLIIINITIFFIEYVRNNRSRYIDSTDFVLTPLATVLNIHL